MYFLHIVDEVQVHHECDAVDSVKTIRVLFVQPFTTINKVWIPVLIYW